MEGFGFFSDLTSAWLINLLSQKSPNSSVSAARCFNRVKSPVEESNVRKGSDRQVLNLHAQLVAQYLAHRKKDKTKNSLDRKAIFRRPFL